MQQTRPIDVTPHPLGEYLLLRHGKALDLRHEEVIDDELAQNCAGDRFWDHRHVCRIPSMRTAAAALDGTFRRLADDIERGKTDALASRR